MPPEPIRRERGQDPVGEPTSPQPPRRTWQCHQSYCLDWRRRSQAPRSWCISSEQFSRSDGLRKECEKVGELAQLLQSILDSNKKALESLATEKKLRAHLRDVATFVTDCTKDYSLLGRAWEVMWDKKLPKLLAGLKDWILYFLMDSMVRFGHHHDNSPELTVHA